MRNTYNYLLSNFNIKNLKIQNSSQELELYLNPNLNYTYPISKSSTHYEIKIYFLENQKAPIEKNSKIGTIKFFSDENFIYETPIYTQNSIFSTSFKEFLFYTMLQIKNLFINI